MEKRKKKEKRYTYCVEHAIFVQRPDVNTIAFGVRRPPFVLQRFGKRTFHPGLQVLRHIRRDWNIKAMYPWMFRNGHRGMHIGRPSRPPGGFAAFREKCNECDY